MTIDQDKLGELLGRFVGDLGATAAAGNVVVGHRLGLYRALAEGPATAEELARRTGTDARYVAEWLRGQAAGGYVSCDPAAIRFSLTEEQAFALAEKHESSGGRDESVPGPRDAHRGRTAKRQPLTASS